MSPAIDVAEYASKLLSKNADDHVITVAQDNKAQLKFSNNKVSTTQRWLRTEIEVFASVKNRTVMTQIQANRKSAEDAVAKILKVAKNLPENKEYSGIANGPFKYSKTENFDSSIANLDIVDITKESINLAIENGAKRTSGLMETSIESLHLITSRGVQAKEQFSGAYFSIRALCDNNGSGHSVTASSVKEKLNFRRAATEAALNAKQSQNPKSIIEGKYDIILMHMPSANLMDNVAGSASIFNVESGLSFLAKNLGKKVASPALNLVDDPTISGSISSRKFDQEGVPTQRNEIIKKGILKTYLHNTSTAKKHKTKTTANAGLISPSPINPIVESGDHKLDEMISKIKKGLLITNVWYTRFQNHTTGDFSTIPRDAAYLIENGKIKNAVKAIRISDNMINMLKNCEAVGNDQRETMTWEIETPITTPELLIRNVNISKSVE